MKLVRSFWTLLAGVALGIGGIAAWSAFQPSVEARPPRLPVVAVGSRITWNVPYVDGASEQQTLDVYAPPDVKGAPVVVYVHRGEWARGDKSEVSYKPKLFNERGIVFVSVNYRLSDVARHPAQVDDVAAAVRWVVDHIAEHGGSPQRIVLMGHSAGCHIASLVGLDPRPLAKVGLTPDVLRGVVCWSGGAYDLAAKVAEGGCTSRTSRRTSEPSDPGSTTRPRSITRTKRVQTSASSSSARAKGTRRRARSAKR